MAYDSTKFLNRNDVYEFANRARKNLRFIIEAEKTGADVHPITQVVCSLMGIAVFPWEEGLSVFAKNSPLEEIFDKPRLDFEVEQGEIGNFGELLRSVRNSVSHRGIDFNSDSRKLSEVSIRLTEKWKKNGPVRTVTRFKGDQLLRFCDGVLNHASQRTG